MFSESAHGSWETSLKFALCYAVVRLAPHREALYGSAVYTGVDAESPFKGAFQQPTRCSYWRQAAENDITFTMRKCETPLYSLAFAIALSRARGREVIRTQTRPAIEFVSGEEGLRPKSFFFVLSVVKYAHMHPLMYSISPGSSCGAEGCGGAVLPKHRSLPRVVRSLSESVPCKLSFSH